MEPEEPEQHELNHFRVKNVSLQKVEIKTDNLAKMRQKPLTQYFLDRELCREQKDTSVVSMGGDGGCDDHGPGGGAEKGDCQDGREVYESQDTIKYGQAKYVFSQTQQKESLRSCLRHHLQSRQHQHHRRD